MFSKFDLMMRQGFSHLHRHKASNRKSESMCRRLYCSPWSLEVRRWFGKAWPFFFFPFSQMLFVHQHEWVRKARFWMHLLNWFLCREACRADKFFMHDVPENADKGRLPHRRFVLHGDKVWPAGWCLHWPMKWTVRFNLKSVVVSTIYRDKTL